MKTYTHKDLKGMDIAELTKIIKECEGSEKAAKIVNKVEEKGGTLKDKTNWVRFAANSIIKRKNTLVIK